MRLFSLRFAIATLAFLVGVGASTGWYILRPKFSRGVEEANIIEAVFRHQIAEESLSENRRVIFLSVTQDTSPSDDFMRRFVDTPLVRKLSQANKRGDGVTDKQTGERGIILGVHRIEWLSDAEVTVGSFGSSGDLGCSGINKVPRGFSVRSFNAKDGWVWLELTSTVGDARW